MGRPRRYFTVNIYYTSGGFCSKVKLDAKSDSVDGMPVTTQDLARKYVNTYLIRPGEEKWCNII